MISSGLFLLHFSIWIVEGNKKYLFKSVYNQRIFSGNYYFPPGSKAQPTSLSNRTSIDRPGRCEPGFCVSKTSTINPVISPLKGGDPAAPSGTATLLRLRPSYRTRPRHLPPLRVSSVTSIVLGFHDVTGGVYKARERIHRSVLTCGY